MKSGTTTLFRDLSLHPHIFLTSEKESNALTTDYVLTDEGQSAYEGLFVGAKPWQVTGEVCASYSMRGQYPDIPSRALQLLGPELKLIYIVREPLARVISHHHHNFSYGLASSNINDDVRADPAYIGVSSYMWQLEAWLEHFPLEQVAIVLFEDYIAHRRRVVDQICNWLNIPAGGGYVDPSVRHNLSSQRHVALGGWRFLASHPYYRRYLRPLFPWSLRSMLGKLLLRKAPAAPQPPDSATVQWLHHRLRNDVMAFGTILRESSQSLWHEWT